jgi:hypothetical protein
VFASKRPHLYDLFHGSGAQAPIAALFVPVLRPGAQEVAYALGFGLRTERLRDLLWRSELPEGSVAALVDRSGLIVSPVRDHDRWWDRRPPPSKGRLGDRASGQLALTNLEGTRCWPPSRAWSLGAGPW